MITPGGEAAFVGRMVEESVVLKDKCRCVVLEVEGAALIDGQVVHIDVGEDVEPSTHCATPEGTRGR